MFRLGQSIRFTADEVERFLQVGLDFAGAKSQRDIDRAVADWVSALDAECPGLLEKIATALAHARGMKPPAKLTALPCQDRETIDPDRKS